MPKTMYVTNDHRHSGVDITFTKTRNRLDIGGWFDGIVGIESHSYTLREFFDALGITETDCRKAFKEANGA